MTAAVPAPRLEDVADFNPSLDASLADDETVSFLPMSAVDAEAVDAVDTVTRLFKEVSKGYTPFIADDVLVAKITPCFENGKIAQAKPTCQFGFGSTEFHVIRPHATELDPRYLVYFLRQERIRKDGELRMTGSAGQRRVPEHFLANLKIPLPPLPEQRRTAEILDKADVLRAKRRVALTQLDTLTQSIFIDMFGDPATNPKGWPVTRLEDEITSVRYGTGSPPPYVDDGVPFIRATNIKAGTISPRDLKRISPAEGAQIAKCRVDAGNLIIVRSGVNTGDCAIVPSEYDGAYAAFDLVIELPWANAVFYNFLINSPYGKVHLAPLTRRAAQPHLNADQVRSLRFISPDEPSKQRFAMLVGFINDQKRTGEVDLREMDALFAALQHSAFRGEL